MVKTKSKVKQVYAGIEEVLGQIIDEWYERVAGHYLTQQDLESHSRSSTGEAELKYFHDEAGHRIKFNKFQISKLSLQILIYTLFINLANRNKSLLWP